jgi:spore germination protein (amino acid permease)
MDKISSRHFMFIIWGTTIVSIKTNMNIFFKDGGRDTWIVIIISSLLILLFMIYIMRIIENHKYISLANVYEIALGRVPGRILIFTFVFNLVLTLIEASAVEANAMHTNIFLETPHWYLLVFFLIPAIYTVKRGLIPVVTVAIIGVFFAMVAGVNLIILTHPYKDHRYILPVLEHGITRNFLISVVKSLGLYGSLSIMFCYVKYVEDKKNLLKYATIAFLVVMQMHIVAMTGAITSFGVNRVEYLAYPKLTQTQQINLFGFLESGEFFVMFQIIGGWFTKYVLSFCALLKILKDLNYYNKYIVFYLSAFVLLAAYFVSKTLLRLEPFLNFYCYASLINFILIPLIVFTIFNIKQNKKEKNA